MSIKDYYYYFFYKYYRLFEYFKTTRWLTDFKAMLIMSALEAWIVGSLINYYNVIRNQRGDVAQFRNVMILMGIAVVLLNYIAFIKNDKWKGYVAKFDKWEKKKNELGSWIVAVITLLIIANFVYSATLVRQLVR